MSKPIYLDQELCTKLQSKGLECGSGMWWEHKYWTSADGKFTDEWKLYPEFDQNEINPPARYKAYELHIDILGSRDNLERLFTDQRELTASFSGYCIDSECNTNDELDEAWRWKKWQYDAHQLLELILDGNPDQAINLIKEAV